MTRMGVAFVWLAVMGCCASAQSGSPPFQSPSAPDLGGAGIRAPTPPLIIGASQGNDILRHRAPTGSPCLTVSGFARPHTVNPNLYDHVITVNNGCAQRITMRVCYYNSMDCVPIEIPGGERKEAILGTMPSTKDFRFEFRENF